MKAVPLMLLILPVLLFSSCDEKEEPVVKRPSLTERLAAERKSPEKKSAEALVKLEAATRMSEVSQAMLALGQQVQKLCELKVKVGRHPAPDIQQSIEQMEANEAALFAEADQLCASLERYRPHLADPGLVDQQLSVLAKLKLASGR